MEKYQSAVWIIVVLGIVMLFLGIKTKSHIILNFVLRSISGTILIFAINFWMEMQGLSFTIGLNPGTVLTSGILGFPGVILLLGIKIYSVL